MLFLRHYFTGQLISLSLADFEQGQLQSRGVLFPATKTGCLQIIAEKHILTREKAVYGGEHLNWQKLRSAYVSSVPGASTVSVRDEMD